MESNEITNWILNFWKTFKNEKNRLIFVFSIIILALILLFLFYNNKKDLQNKELIEKLATLEKQNISWTNNKWTIDVSWNYEDESTNSNILYSWDSINSSWNENLVIMWNSNNIWKTDVTLTSYPPKPCPIEYWEWIQSWIGWEDWSYGKCEVVKCNEKYHLENGSCLFNTSNCSINNWLWTKTWETDKRWKCVFKECKSWDWLINDICVHIWKYPWCDISDIKIGEQIWAGCNVWASKSYNKQPIPNDEIPDSNVLKFIWWYYQWWKNDSSRSNENTGNKWDWQIRDDDAWWDTTATQESRKWPCARWYHVPTKWEWEIAIKETWDWYKLRTILKLPFGWVRVNEKLYPYMWSQWQYWTSTTSKNLSIYLIFDSNKVEFKRRLYFKTDKTQVSRLLWMNVRCIKNSE